MPYNTGRNLHLQKKKIKNNRDGTYIKKVEWDATYVHTFRGQEHSDNMPFKFKNENNVDDRPLSTFVRSDGKLVAVVFSIVNTFNFATVERT